MDTIEYKPNSHKSKEEQREAAEDKKKIEKVVRGAVKTKKKNEISKLANVFISEDAKNVKSYVFMDVLVPAIKKAISDIVTDGIDMVLYGGSGRRDKKSSASKISYSRYYDKRDDRRREEPRARTAYNYDEIILESMGEATDVLDRMDEIIDRYNVVYVADLYDLVGLPHNYTDNRYGWTNISNAKPTRTRDGYVLNLPRPMAID